MHMSEVGSQLGQVSLDIDPAAMPPAQGVDGQAVAKVQQARSAGIAAVAQADLVGQFDKGPAHAPLRDARALLGEEETGALRCGTQAVTASGIVLRPCLVDKQAG